LPIFKNDRSLDTQKSNNAFEGPGFKFTGYTEMQKVILLLNQENFNLQPFPCGLAEDWSKGREEKEREIEKSESENEEGEGRERE